MLNKNNVQETEFIEKKWLKQLIFKDIAEVKGITQQQLSAVTNKYPIVQTIYNIVSAFKKIVFSKNANELNNWIEQTEKTGI